VSLGNEGPVALKTQGLIFSLSKDAKKLRLSQAQAKKLVEKLRLRLLPMTPVPQSLRLYCSLSPYFLSDLKGKRVSEFVFFSVRAG
jgi:hypothetical protein